jgi:hypothetical protein
MTDGCPLCEWEGRVAESHSRAHLHYQHIIVKDGDVFHGPTCTAPRRAK